MTKCSPNPQLYVKKWHWAFETELKAGPVEMPCLYVELFRDTHFLNKISPWTPKGMRQAFISELARLDPILCIRVTAAFAQWDQEHAAP